MGKQLSITMINDNVRKKIFKMVYKYSKTSITIIVR